MYNAVDGGGPSQSRWLSALVERLTALLSLIWWAVTGCGFLKKKETLIFKDGQLKVKVLRAIAEGGFAFVYLCQDDQGNQYAAKKLLIQTREQEDAARWEIEVLQSLSAPSIIALIDSRMVTNPETRVKAVYMLFPYLKRGTLVEILERQRAVGRHFSEKEALTIFRGVCQAVLALHRHNPPWVHADIKLNNVMLDESDKPYLLDFGSVTEARKKIKTRSEAIKVEEWAEEHCTTSYCAPEFFDCETGTYIDERTDVWSLGCLLYGLAFGASPFEALDEGFNPKLAVQSPENHIKPPDNEASRYSEDFLHLISWVLQPKAKNRPYVDQIITRIDRLVKNQVNSSVVALNIQSPHPRSASSTAGGSSLGTSPDETPSSALLAGNNWAGDDQNWDS